MNRFFLILILSTCFSYILRIFQVSPEAFSTFLDSVGVFSGWSLWRIFNLLQHEHKGTVPTTFWRFYFLKWIIIVFTILWFFWKGFFLTFFTPTLITGFGLMVMSPFQHIFERMYIKFLWRNRRGFLIFPLAFRYRRIVYSVIRFVLYIPLISVWGDVFRKFDQQNIISLITDWLLMIVTSQAVNDLFSALLIGLMAFLLIKVTNRILTYYIEKRYQLDSVENNFLFTRLKTMMAIIRTAVSILLGTPAIFMILSKLSLGSTEWVASVGLAGAGVTFGLQSIVRDFITGFFIIFENNLMVGDEVEIDNKGGKVEVITMRTLKIRSETGMLFTIPFCSITVIGNRNRYFSAVLMNISVAYDEDLDKVQYLIEKAFLLLKKTAPVNRQIMGGLEFRGVNEVTSYSVVLLAKIKTAPNCQDSVRRQFNKILKNIFDEAGIKVPVAPGGLIRGQTSLTNTQF